MAKREERKPRNNQVNDGFVSKLVDVRRVVKVVKGGRTLRFSALVVVGDKKGHVGYGTGKAAEVSVAVEKATTSAKKNLITVPIVDGTIPHETIGKFSSTSIIMLPSKQGTGIIAGGSARAVLELSGLKDITAKNHGSTNKINGVKATIKGLLSLRTKEQIAELRGKSVEEL